MKKISLPAASC